MSELSGERPCTCHPDDNPPKPCPGKFALSECRAAAPTGDRTHGGIMYDDYAMKQINRLAFENGQFRHLLGEAVSMMSKFDQHLTMRQHEAWGMDQVGDLIERINGAVNAEWAP